ncbi:hypothetical protein ACFQZ4_22210 [Catellatospora coxensis]
MITEDAAHSADGSSVPPVPPEHPVPAQRAAPDPVSYAVPDPQAAPGRPGGFGAFQPYPTLWPDPALLHRPRRRWGRVIALVATGLALACAAAGGLAVVLVPPVLEQFAAAGTQTPAPRPARGRATS